MNYVNAKEARQYFQVTGPTLSNWVNEGKLKVKKLSSRKFLYDIDSYLMDDIDIDNRHNVIYARVSNTKQYNDLNEQIETIKKYCQCNGIIIDNVYKDIASGMNENRKELNELINDVVSGKIKTIYISFKDRLTRFGYEYFKNIFSRFDTNIIVLDEQEESSKTFQDEITEDLISIIHHFSMKMYSNRRKKLKEFKHFLEDS